MTGNGFGKIVGTTQVSELGVIETPVLLTGTLSTFRVADALAFPTAPPDAELAGPELTGPKPTGTVPLPDSALDPLFVAAMDVTEEAILNSLFAAETTTGFRGHVRHAVPLDLLQRLCAARGVLRAV